MGRRPVRYSRAVGALLVAVFHGALALLLWIETRPKPAKQPTELTFVSVWLTPVSEAAPPDQEAKTKPTKAVARRTPRERQALPQEQVASPGVVAPITPTVDWAGEAAVSARKQIEQQQASSSTFSALPTPIRKPCVSKPSSLEWGRDEKRAGLAGGVIPYVRIGKRCVIALGFFGCTLDELPKANGHLLDDMDDPDRPSSSVPDVNNCEAERR
jgi:hypothetical protein